MELTQYLKSVKSVLPISVLLEDEANKEGDFEDDDDETQYNFSREEEAMFTADPSKSLYRALRKRIAVKYHFDSHSKLPRIPLFANLRCGLWYSSHFDGSAYFKSTDGHYGQWQINQSRLNLHFAEAACNGAIIVDSTRKGKIFPDSFSRTIPIWACVINRLIATERKDPLYDTTLHLPPWITQAEQSRVNSLIDHFVQTIRNSGVDLSSVSKVLHKPLRPLWICNSGDGSLSLTPNGTSMEELIEQKEYAPLICLSASSGRGVKGTDMDTMYIPGAGDDHESWSKGLTPELFWKHREQLIDENTGPMDVERRVSKIVAGHSRCVEDHRMYAIPPTGMILCVGEHIPSISGPFAVLDCSPRMTLEPTDFDSYEYIPMPEEKTDSQIDPSTLLRIVEFSQRHLTPPNKRDVVIYSNSGLNGPTCVSLCLLTRFYDGEGEWIGDKKDMSQVIVVPSPQFIERQITKGGIRNMLMIIERVVKRGKGPPRVFMNQINKFFLSKEDK
ncbi:hypothetical protein PROFUN_11889 [Planoprotostelium fungivorum]|uniref:Initiator tRNA phosphoribosyl transferase n=1 Tax=Planoprotostelium fungivorum TaxID=1890364 RepID=A0A2P6N902_9EUKA|nr:hypothetical protein PROFUN_11889 [Planoprotostelium fungivorum]